jgi:SpoU rRNA methylase family enzyme
MTSTDLRAVRAAQNQSLFRNVNQRLVDLNEAFAALDDRSVFVCECARIDCVEQLDVALQDYARIRTNPRWFIVAVGDNHVLPDVEQVVERHPTFLVIEKVGAAAAVAEQEATRL